MSDPRLTPDPALVTEETPASVVAPLSDLCVSPAGRRDRQLLLGDPVTVLGRTDGWCYLRSEKDGHHGHLRADALGPRVAATHRVSAAATHVYEGADIKSRDRLGLSFGSAVTVSALTERFAETPIGFIPRTHLAPMEDRAKDPATVAALFLGTPYLWGGNSRWGIDCSGLVQAALLACGIPCPSDSDLQQTVGQAAEGPCRRNDLLFWKGHVALVTDPETMIHANGHSMSVAYEPIDTAIARIDAAGDGPVIAHRRF